MMIKGKPDRSVEMLVLLVVLTLVPTWSDGLVLKKCELRSQLEAAFSELLAEKAADIIAKCKFLDYLLSKIVYQAKDSHLSVTLCEIITNI